jgi:hypothetical protein
MGQASIIRHGTTELSMFFSPEPHKLNRNIYKNLITFYLFSPQPKRTFNGIKIPF